MIEQAWPAALLAIRALCHLLVFIRVVTYTASAGSAHRRTVGFVAAIFAGFNLAEMLRVVMNFQAFVSSVELYLPGIMVCVLIFVTWSGGNMSAWFPRKVLEKLP